MNRNVQCVGPAAAGLASLPCFAATAGVDKGGRAAHGLMVEIGSAGEWPRNGDGANFGGSMAAEVMPIEIGLEAEIGRSTLTAAPNSELSGGRAIALADLQCSGMGLIAERGARGQCEVMADQRESSAGSSSRPRACGGEQPSVRCITGRLPVGFPSRHSAAQSRLAT
jgi:hypothetical protein